MTEPTWVSGERADTCQAGGPFSHADEIKASVDTSMAKTGTNRKVRRLPDIPMNDRRMDEQVGKQSRREDESRDTRDQP